MNAITAIETREEANRKAEASTLLSPRFYTTDYAAMDKLDVTPVRAEWDAMMAEYERDNNHDHFQRSADFADEIRELPPELRKEFVDFLISQLVESGKSAGELLEDYTKNFPIRDCDELRAELVKVAAERDAARNELHQVAGDTRS